MEIEINGFEMTSKTKYYYLDLEINGKEVEVSFSVENNNGLEDITNYDILTKGVTPEEVEEIEIYLDEINLSEAE